MATPNTKGLSDLGLEPGIRVLVRVDYNVPFRSGTREISDDSRIEASLPTVRYLTERGCRVVLCSHLGRPRGRRTAEDSLAPVARRLSEMLGEPVTLAGDCVGPEAERAVGGVSNGGALLLENLRFHAGEEANDADFAAKLTRLADCYVNDGFGAAHRKHASTYGVARMLPAAAGLLMEREMNALARVTRAPDHPYAVVVGGAKVADKLPVIENLSSIADIFLIGGGMAAAFLAAAGYGWDADAGERAAARRILERAENSADRGGYEVVLPVDVAAADRFAGDATARNVRVAGVGATTGGLILDIGRDTVDMYAKRLASARTVVWNGPMGVFEWERFANGTRGIAGAIAGLRDAYTVTGGGSTSDSVRSLGLAERFSHVSTGGGATLEYLEGRELPGIAALVDR